MSIINITTKHTKYEKDWKENVTRLSSVLLETEQKSLTKLTDEVVKINDESKTIQQQIQKLETKKQDLGDIVGRQRRTNEQLDDLKANYTSGTKTKEKQSFLGSATNQYDWTTKIKFYYPITYSDNLYQGTISGSPIKITEQEAIKLLTRAIKALEKIEQSKFNTKFTASSHTSGTNHLPAIQKLAQDGLKDNQIIGKDANGQDLPDQGQPANHRTLNRLEYSFKSQFVADADIQKTPSGTAFTPQSTETITQTKINNFFSFINDISKDGTINPDFLTELKSDADILKNIENNLSWKLVPAQKTALETNKLADYGIQVTNSNNTKLYLSDKHDKAVQFSITEGLKSWIELIQAFFSDLAQQTKLAHSFNSDPYTQLLTDIGNNTHSAHWELPESLTDLQTIADQLEMEKLSAAGKITALGEKIEKKAEELTTKNTELTTKDTELTTLIQKIITKKREELNKFNLQEFENKTSSRGEDNRKTSEELWKIKQLLLSIRYLENEGDATLNSSVADENTALATVEDIFTKAMSCWHQSSWSSIGWVQGASEKENVHRPNSEKIKLIKENKNNDYQSLTYYHDQLVELEKLVKLTNQQQKIKDDLKAAIDTKSPQENLQEWRDTLKTISTELETAFTDEKITKWKAKKDGQAKFDNTASIKSLLEKVCVKKSDGAIEKVDDNFIAFIKGKDAATDTLSKLIEKKEPKEVILLIHQWEFDKSSDEKKKERYLKFAWSEKGGKQKIDSKDKLEDSEKEKFNEYLYECAIGKIVESTLSKPTEQSDNNDDSPTTPSEEKEWYQKFGYMALWLPPLVVGGACLAIFWKQINTWWNGPSETEGEISESSVEEESGE